MSDAFGDRLSNVVQMCSDLIAINTSNPTHPEAPAADYVSAVLSGCGIESERFEAAPGRVSVVGRVQGVDPTLPPLLVHCHLDVVPAVASDWSVDPFSGLVEDGYVWGRGAVDMKGMVAAVLSVVTAYHDAGRKPRRDLVLAFFADEEGGGEYGAGFVTQQHAEAFAGCEEAIGEVGGFSHRLSDTCRFYLVSTAEKGVYWARLRASGNAGHGSMLNESNAVSILATAVARVAKHEFRYGSNSSVERFLDEARSALGTPEASADQILDRIGPLARMIRATLQDTANPTTLSAGYKTNVIPSIAEATVDCRFLPGHQEQCQADLREVAGDEIAIETEFLADAVEVPWNVPLLDSMQAALRRFDPAARVVPYMSSAFTDAKWLTKLGIRCYGFCPLLLPDDLDFSALFHAVDERVPVKSLEFAVKVLDRFFETY
jgi:acetylornithine deacetylase/succinyl-diaminopimelate desuccinylase-like protein